MNLAVIGQAKTALIIDGMGVVTSVHARKTGDQSGPRLIFKGEARIDPKIMDHTQNTVIALVDRIATALGVDPVNYEIAVKNVGATALQNLDLSLSGYSLDLAVLMATLSATLQLPISDEIVFTGQVAVAEGHFLPVAGIPEKLQAAADDSSISQFVFAALDVDDSAKVLSPEETDRIRKAIIAHQGKLEVKAIHDMEELLEIVVSEEDICTASLRSGFFAWTEDGLMSASPVDNAIRFLGNDNDKRFWKALEAQLLQNRFARAKQLLAIFVEYHVRKQTYAADLGLKLWQLIVSLPPFTRKKRNLFPLIEMRNCLRLAQLATEAGDADVRLLYKASFGDADLRGSKREHENVQPKQKETLSNSLLENLLDQLSADTIAREVLLPIDAARASYVVDRVTVESYEEFLDSVSAFFAHLLRHRNPLVGVIDKNRVGSDALDLLKGAFYSVGEEKGAYAEAINGIRGGLRYIFDEMTCRLKEEERRKYVRMVLKTAIDPLDFDTKTTLIQSLMNQLRLVLPEEIRRQPPERYALDYEIIIEAYAQSLDQLIGTIKLL